MEASPARILVVDDDPAALLLCAANLELLGLQVIEATSGEQALERALSEAPNLVLTDVAMPGLSGFDLAEALRLDERTRAIPIIFITGETSLNVKARARAVGALGFVTKPFEPQALAEIVSRALSQLESHSPEPIRHSWRRD